MPDQATATRPADRADPSGRTVSRRRNLPGGRAVVGAFLVTLAAVGIFTAYLRSNAVPSTEYLVAARDLLPGDVITDQDLRAVAIELPEEQVSTTAANASAMVDRVVLSPMAQGELIGVGDTADPAEVAGTSSVTVPLETSRSLGGELEAGDRVDVIATWDGSTRYVASDLPVIRAHVEGTTTSVTVAAPTPQAVLAVANAIDTAEVFLARTNPTTTTAGVAPVTPDSPPVVPGGSAAIPRPGSASEPPDDDAVDAGTAPTITEGRGERTEPDDATQAPDGTQPSPADPGGRATPGSGDG